MNRKFLLVAVGMATLVAISPACKKCNTCVAKDQDGVVRYTYPEVCGSKKDLSTYADRCKSEYGQYDYTCQCGEDL